MQFHHGSFGSWPADASSATTLAREVFGAANLLLNLEAVNNGCQLAENLVRLLVEFELGGDQVSKVSERFRGIKDLLFRSALQM